MDGGGGYCTCNDTEYVDSAKSMPLVDNLKRQANQQLEDQVGDEVEISGTEQANIRTLPIRGTGHSSCQIIFIMLIIVGFISWHSGVLCGRRMPAELVQACDE